MTKHALGTQVGGPTIVAQRNACGPIANEAEHDSVTFLNVVGYLVFDDSEVVLGKRVEDGFEHPWVNDPRATDLRQTVAVIELILVKGMLRGDLDDGGHCPIILDTERHEARHSVPASVREDAWSSWAGSVDVLGEADLAQHLNAMWAPPLASKVHEVEARDAL